MFVNSYSLLALLNTVLNIKEDWYYDIRKKIHKSKALH
jgi:hypothetical protein